MNDNHEATIIRHARKVGPVVMASALHAAQWEEMSSEKKIRVFWSKRIYCAVAVFYDLNHVRYPDAVLALCEGLAREAHTSPIDEFVKLLAEQVTIMEEE